LLLGLAGCLACQSQSGPTGSIQFQVAFAGGPGSGAVANVAVDLLTDARSPMAGRVGLGLQRSGARWGALLAGVPEGKRIVVAQAFDGSGTRLYHGEATVQVQAGTTLLLLLTLRPDRAEEGGLVIESLGASSISVDFLSTVSLFAVATEPGPMDIPGFFYSWSASAGSFVGETNQPAVLWQAPPGPEPLVATIGLRVSDRRGASAALAVSIGVHVALENVQVSASINNPPRIDALSARQDDPAAGLVALRVTAHDPDGDQLGYSWSSVDCPGTFVAPVDRAETTFQLGALPPSHSCLLRVTVEDGHGGSAVGQLQVTSGQF